ncbi:MAG: hypothetical protein Q4A63_07965 [Butyricicoccus pullicaecorum]|nr:hypothetical protein [Butyricicoccus pullicaecorum]
MVVNREAKEARDYIKRVLRSYPAICKKPLDQRTRNERRRVDSVKQLSEFMEFTDHAADKRKIIELVYFRQSHTLAGAAMQIPVGERTAQKWNAQIIETLAQIMDLM